MSCCCGGNGSPGATGAQVTASVPPWEQSNIGGLAGDVASILQGINLKTVFWTAVLVIGAYWILED